MSLPDDRLEAELSALGPMLTWPEPGDLAPAVSERLRAGRRAWGSRRWALVAAAALVLLLAAGSLTALPGLRRAVADWLGLPGVRVERVESGRDLPSPAATPELAATVIEDALERTEPVHQALWGQLGSAERVLIAAVADGIAPTSRALAAAHRVARGTLDAAADRLADQGHLLRQPRRTRLVDPLLAEWLRRR